MAVNKTGDQKEQQINPVGNSKKFTSVVPQKKIVPLISNFIDIGLVDYSVNQNKECSGGEVKGFRAQIPLSRVFICAKLPAVRMISNIAGISVIRLTTFALYSITLNDAIKMDTPMFNTCRNTIQNEYADFNVHQKIKEVQVIRVHKNLFNGAPIIKSINLRTKAGLKIGTTLSNFLSRQFYLLFVHSIRQQANILLHNIPDPFP